jgi:hypothetical protein
MLIPRAPFRFPSPQSHPNVTDGHCRAGTVPRRRHGPEQHEGDQRAAGRGARSQAAARQVRQRAERGRVLVPGRQV